jgi:hypothetical protein
MTPGIPKDSRPDKEKSGKRAGLEIHGILVIRLAGVLE